MSEALRNSALRALEIFSEGGAFLDARNKAGINGKDWARMRREHPDISDAYEKVLADRAYAMFDEAYVLSTDNDKPPQQAREQAAIRMKLGEKYHPQRFSDRLRVEHEVGPSLTAAIDAARRRALQPPCDLEQVTDAEYRAIPPLIEQRATDSLSGAPAFRPPNPFED